MSQTAIFPDAQGLSRSIVRGAACHCVYERIPEAGYTPIDLIGDARVAERLQLQLVSLGVLTRKVGWQRCAVRGSGVVWELPSWRPIPLELLGRRDETISDVWRAGVVGIEE